MRTHASKAWLLLIPLLMADVAVFILQKAASKSDAEFEGFAYLAALLKSPIFWIALALTPVQLLLWTRTLSRADLGWAYPVTALAYPLTMIAATAIFAERYSWHVWLGALLITLGAAVLGPPERTTPTADAPKP